MCPIAVCLICTLIVWVFFSPLMYNLKHPILYYVETFQTVFRDECWKKELLLIWWKLMFSILFLFTDGELCSDYLWVVNILCNSLQAFFASILCKHSHYVEKVLSTPCRWSEQGFQHLCCWNEMCLHKLLIVNVVKRTCYRNSCTNSATCITRRWWTLFRLSVNSPYFLRAFTLSIEYKLLADNPNQGFTTVLPMPCYAKYS